MKAKFNKKWNASKQVRKQRKYRYNAPLHTQGKFMATTLDKELRKKYGMRNVEVRKGDEVKIMRGKFKGKQGKVGTAEVQRTRISVDGIERAKKEGTKVAVWFHPSNVKIISINSEDSKRFKRNRKDGMKEEKKEEKVTSEKKTEKKEKPSMKIETKKVTKKQNIGGTNAHKEK